MLEVFLHGQLALYLSIVFTILFLIGVGILISTDKEEDFWDNVLPAVIIGALIFFFWQVLLVLIVGIGILVSPVYAGVLIGKWLNNTSKKSEEKEINISERNKIILKNNPNLSKT